VSTCSESVAGPQSAILLRLMLGRSTSQRHVGCWAGAGGYHALRHSFISILVAQGKTWNQIAAFVGHLDQRTTQRYIHFMPKDKRETANSIPFDF